jgi:uncharacterized protein (DUF1015 family)
MATIAAFHGIRFRAEEGADLGRLVAPPYDVIGLPGEKRLQARHPHNAVRLELRQLAPDEEPTPARYADAAATFRRWLAEGVLARDPRPAIYPYRQRYEVEGKDYTRTGFFCALRLEEFKDAVVVPHESTFAKPKADRGRLIRKCQAEFSPVFGLYSGRNLVAEMLDADRLGAPVAAGRDLDGIEHHVWRLTDHRRAGRIAESIRPESVLIADGHHRYETALRLAHEMRRRHPEAPPTAAFNFVLVMLVSLDDPGLTILPTHRVVRANRGELTRLQREIRRTFSVSQCRTHAATERAMEQRAPREHVFGLYCGKGCHEVLRYQGDPESLDVTVLQERLFAPVFAEKAHEGRIAYRTDAREARRMVDSGEFQAAVFVNPPEVRQVQEIASARRKMPHKSTFFYPKVPSGVVIHGIAPDERVDLL